MFYHFLAWLIRPSVPLRHRRSGVPLSLHSFGTLRAPPWRRMTKKNPYNRPRHPELDSGSVPPSLALCVLAIRCKKSLRRAACYTEQQSPVTLNLIQGLYRPSMALYVLAIRCKKSIQQSPVTLNLIQGLYRHPCALYLLPRKPPLPEPVEGTFLQKKTSPAKDPGIF